MAGNDASNQLTIYVENTGPGMCCLFLSLEGILHFLCESSGDVLAVDEDCAVASVCQGGGMPSGAVFDRHGVLYVADPGHGAVVTLNSESKQQVVVRAYEDHPLKGPSSITCDHEGNLYFTDSGPVGETGLHNPRGSLYAIVRGRNGGGQLLRPIALECLAYPCGVAVASDGRCIYVAEQMANRVLRFIRGPSGTFHFSVFHQFSGGVGPKCVACAADGNVLVGSFDYAHLGGNVGTVSILSQEGEKVGEIQLPGPEITGLAISLDGRSLFVAEASTARIYRSLL